MTYALDPKKSRGRFLPGRPKTSERDDFQRDRDRIIHAKAFRRLAHKTQVFVYYEGDHYRNRLTHSLEVAQISRDCARALKVNEDMAEIAALAHDIGHPPFGHAGEDALNAAMRDFGGFDHNGQALRCVTFLENRYPEHRGLNLTFESLESIVKHNGPLLNPGQAPESGLCRAILDFAFYPDLAPADHAGLEAQIAAACDDIAYHAHDTDDGLRAGFFTLQDLEEVSVCARLIKTIRDDYPNICDAKLRYELTRRLIGFFAKDFLAQTRENISRLKPETPDDIRKAGETIGNFSEEGEALNKNLKAFLFKNMYKHERIKAANVRAKKTVTGLFDFYMDNPDALPEDFCADVDNRAVRICDFIAGMTDKFALEQYEKFIGLTK